MDDDAADPHNLEAPEQLRQEFNISKDMFDTEDSLALNLSLEDNPTPGLSSTAREIEIPNDGDTDSASEDETYLPSKYGLSPFLLKSFKNRNGDVKGICLVTV